MSDVVSGQLPATPADLQQPLPVDQTDRPISVSRSCVKPPQPLALEGFDMDYDAEILAEAVRSLHSQAHTDPTDSIYAVRCMREPCRSVGSLLDHATADVRGLFGIEATAS